MADIKLFIREYDSFKSSFKETSLDNDNNIYLCNDTSQEVINFDKLIENLYPDSNKRPKSFDTIYIYKNLIFCIEFKNQKPSDIDNSEIRGKILNGKDELIKLLTQLNIQKNDYNFIYCIIYKDCSMPYDSYKCGIDKGKIRFGLEDLTKNSFLTKVYTDSVSFFTKEFKKQFKKELMC